MFGWHEVTAAEEAMRQVACGVDGAELGVAEAGALLERVVAVEKLAGTVKALLGARVAAVSAIAGVPADRVAERLARASGSSLGAARTALETGRRLGSLPVLSAAARQGMVSAAQAAAIARAAATNPRAERRLVDLAERSSLAELTTECERARAAGDADAEARRRGVHAERRAWRRVCADGSGEITYRATVADVATVWAVIEGYARAAFDRARCQNKREAAGAYLADGVHDMAEAAGHIASACGDGPVDRASGTTDGGPGGRPATAGDAPSRTLPAEEAQPPAEPQAGSPAAPAMPAAPATSTASADTAPDAPLPRPPAAGRRPSGRAGRVRRAAPTKVIVRIDWEALVRGRPIEGEVCEITGVGPVPVEVVREIAASGDAFLAAVVTKGRDVVNVAHLGRRPSAHQLTALEWRGRECTVEGCTRSARMEVDHRIDWRLTHHSRLDELDWLCGYHHDLKSRASWALVAGEGKRPMVPPGDPGHPNAADRRSARRGGRPGARSASATGRGPPG